MFSLNVVAAAVVRTALFLDKTASNRFIAVAKDNKGKLSPASTGCAHVEAELENIWRLFEPPNFRETPKATSQLVLKNPTHMQSVELLDKPNDKLTQKFKS